MTIVLIGFMGVGKTTVATALGQSTTMNVVDLDEMIVRDAPFESVQDIFEEEGEGGFREREKIALAAALEMENMIISCGGGVVEEQDNRVLLKAYRKSVFHLIAPFEEIQLRLLDDTSRPLFKDISVARMLYNRRKAFYTECAENTIDTSGRLVSDIVSEIISIQRQDIHENS